MVHKRLLQLPQTEFFPLQQLYRLALSLPSNFPVFPPLPPFSQLINPLPSHSTCSILLAPPHLFFSLLSLVLVEYLMPASWEVVLSCLFLFLRLYSCRPWILDTCDICSSCPSRFGCLCFVFLPYIYSHHSLTQCIKAQQVFERTTILDRHHIIA